MLIAKEDRVLADVRSRLAAIEQNLNEVKNCIDSADFAYKSAMERNSLTSRYEDLIKRREIVLKKLASLENDASDKVKKLLLERAAIQAVLDYPILRQHVNDPAVKDELQLNDERYSTWLHYMQKILEQEGIKSEAGRRYLRLQEKISEFLQQRFADRAKCHAARYKLLDEKRYLERNTAEIVNGANQNITEQQKKLDLKLKLGYSNYMDLKVQRKLQQQHLNRIFGKAFKLEFILFFFFISSFFTDLEMTLATTPVVLTILLIFLKRTGKNV